MLNTEIAVAGEQVFAFDIPLDLSANESARLIDEICPDGFYPWQLVVWPGAGTRVFCKRSKATKPGQLAEPKVKAAEVTRRAKDAEDDQADAAIVEILTASPRVTVGLLRVRLGRLGYRRGTDWVADAMMRARQPRTQQSI